MRRAAPSFSGAVQLRDTTMNGSLAKE